MAVVHYKFNNSVNYDSLKFDGLAISLRDLKQGILSKWRLKSEDTDLKVVNAQTEEVYNSPSIMIPKNTSLIIARIPLGGVKKQELTASSKAKKWAAFRKETQAAIQEAESGGPSVAEKQKQASDLASASATEMEKITKMIRQSTKDFEPANYKYKVQTGTPSASYVCYKCGKGGHFIQNCPNAPMDSEGAANSPSETSPFLRMKKPSGIPLDHMIIVSEALPGTYKTHTGQFAVPKIDAEAYATGKVERPPFLPELEKKPVLLKKPIPKELKCDICQDLARDAVVIPCCGNSYCDDCIRNKLLESDDHICPSCDSMDVSPDGLIPNQMLRRAVIHFQNETGYTQKALALKQTQEKAAAAAKLAAAAGAILQNKPVIPRGPSVLDFKPPQKAASPPPKAQSAMSVPAPVTPKNTSVPASVGQEPPTPTMDEPARSLSYPSNPPASAATIVSHQVSSVPTLMNRTAHPVVRLQVPVPRPMTTSAPSYYNAPPPVNTSMPAVPPHPSLPYTAFPPPVVNPYAAPPPIVPGVRPPGIPPPMPGLPVPIAPKGPVIPPPVGPLPKPLSEKEFLEEKKRLLIEDHNIKANDPLLAFAKELEKPREKKRSPSPSWKRSRSRSRSRSPLRKRSRTRSRSRGRRYSRSPLPRRSYTPRRSLTPRRSYTPPSRRYSPRRSRSRSPYSPRRYRSPRRSFTPRRSHSRGKYRSLSRSPRRRRPLSRSRSPYRSPPPYRRSYSRSRSPYRRSLSRGRYSPVRRRSPGYRRSYSRDRSPLPRQPYSRQRSPLPSLRPRSPPRNARGHSPPSNSRGRSPPPRGYQSPPRRRSPIRRPQENLSKKPASLSPAKENSKKKRDTNKPGKKAAGDTGKTGKTDIRSRLGKIANQDVKPAKSESKDMLHTTTYERGRNNIVVNLVDSTTDEESQKEDKSSRKVNVSQVEDKVAKTKDAGKGKVEKESEKTENKKPLKTGDDNKENKTRKQVDTKIESVDVKQSSDKATKQDKDQTNAENNKQKENVGKEPKEGSKSEDEKSKEKQVKPETATKVKPKAAVAGKTVKPKKKKSPTRKKDRSKSKSESPPRVKEPLVLQSQSDSFRAKREREGLYGDRGGNYGRDKWRGSDYRARGGHSGPGPYMGPHGHGPPPPHSDYRGPPMGHADYRGPPVGHTDYRGGYPQGPPGAAGHPGYQDTRLGPPPGRDYWAGGAGYPPGPYPGGHPPPFPHRDPRDDPSYTGRDEDIAKFEQYKQMYDLYNRTYGFAPPVGSGPGGHSPPQGPPPAPPGTLPLSERSPGRRQSPSPRRRRSRSPGGRERSGRDRNEAGRPIVKDYRGEGYRKDGRRDDRLRDEREEKRDDRGARDRSSDREKERERKYSDRTPPREVTTKKDRRQVSASPEHSQESVSEDERASSPDKRKASPDKKKERKLKKKKEKGEGVEKKKKKKKDKEKSKAKKAERKARKEKKAAADSSDNEEDEEVVKKTAKDESQDSDETSESEAEATKGKARKERVESAAESVSTQDTSPKSSEAREEVRALQSQDSIESVGSTTASRPTEQETVVSSSTVKEESNKPIKMEQQTSDSEVSQSDAVVEMDKHTEKRRSIKRNKTEGDGDDTVVEAKKPKLEKLESDRSETISKNVKSESVVKTERQEVEPMEVAGEGSDRSEDELDDIPAPEDELMLDLPEISKWEKDDDPYELSPEPMRRKEKWRPEKQTFLPRSVIEKAEHAFSSKVMKPTVVSSAVSLIQPQKEILPSEDDSDINAKKQLTSKSEKSPADGKRRVVVEGDPKKKDDRRVAAPAQHNVKITVSGNEKRKVATGGGDLREKLRAKQKVPDKARDIDRSHDREDDYNRRDSRVDRKRRDSHKTRRDSREYDRQDSHGGKSSKRSLSRKESVIDDSKFVPDYEDDSVTDDDSEDSSSESSSEEEVVRKKHKHKKNKHKKEKKAKKKKDKKKKKHKSEKRK